VPYGNMMYDKRVVRGSMYATHNIPLVRPLTIFIILSKGNHNLE